MLWNTVILYIIYTLLFVHGVSISFTVSGIVMLCISYLLLYTIDYNTLIRRGVMLYVYLIYYYLLFTIDHNAIIRWGVMLFVYLIYYYLL